MVLRDLWCPILKCSTALGEGPATLNEYSLTVCSNPPLTIDVPRSKSTIKDTAAGRPEMSCSWGSSSTMVQLQSQTMTSPAELASCTPRLINPTPSATTSVGSLSLHRGQEVLRVSE